MKKLGNSILDLKNLKVGKDYKYLGVITGPEIAKVIVEDPKKVSLPDSFFNKFLKASFGKDISELVLFIDADILRVFER